MLWRYGRWTFVLSLLLGLVAPIPALASHPSECAWEYGGGAELHPAPCTQRVTATVTGQVTATVHPTPLPVAVMTGPTGTVYVQEPSSTQNVKVVDYSASVMDLEHATVYALLLLVFAFIAMLVQSWRKRV